MEKRFKIVPTRTDSGKMTEMVLLCCDDGFPEAVFHVDTFHGSDGDRAIHEKLMRGETVAVRFEEVA